MENITVTKTVQDKLLLVSVFVVGMAVLILEIVAIRILSPYYGNTIYSTSSVIGMVLGALSLGYYLGGRLADAHPKISLFYTIIIVAGLLVISVYFLQITLLPLLAILFSITLGPLIFSFFLFFTPMLIFGLVSPFAVKLHKKEGNAVGQQSGEVFFWSTLGSIAGSLLTGFFLIPHFGITAIVIGTGVFLFLFGMICLWVVKAMRAVNVLLLLVFLGAISLLLLPGGFKKSTLLYEKDGVYERIRIQDGQWQERPARFLFQDMSYSAAMYLASDELAYEYTKYYELYKLVKPEAKSAFIIGGGAYSIPKALLKDSPDLYIDVTEIEPELFSLAKQYFNLQENIRLVNYTEDGRYYLTKNKKIYDLMVTDVYYSFFSIPIQFTTKEFFELAKNRLSENGVFVGNFAGSLSKKPPSFILSEMRTFKQIFPNSYFFGVSDPKANIPQNIIFLGINGQKPLDFKNAEKVTNKNVGSVINLAFLKTINIDEFDFTQHREITDNFSPIEYLVSRVVATY